MIYKLYSTKDTIIYKCDDTKNSGMDPQLTLQSYYDITPYSNTITKSATRILIDFEYLSNQKYNYYVSTIQSASILLYISSIQLLYGEPYNINCHQMKQPWKSGIGLDTYKYYYDGATWKYNSKSSVWDEPGGDYNIDTYTSASFTCKNTEYLKLPIYTPTDSHSAPYGYILKFDNDFQNSTTSNVGIINFYSTETHTIYCPSLLLYINDYEYITGSKSSVDENKEIQLYINNIKPEYSVDQIAQFNITCKNMIYDRTWSNSYWSQTQSILPISASCLYRILDVTDFQKQIFIDFDSTYTRISCNSLIGNYFKFDMSQLYENRIYEIQLLFVKSSGIKKLYNNKYIFKVK